MSFAATLMAATASIVVSPSTKVIGCSGPQVVGVMLPLKVPESAPAVPPTTRKATNRAKQGKKSQTHRARSLGVDDQGSPERL